MPRPEADRAPEPIARAWRCSFEAPSLGEKLEMLRIAKGTSEVLKLLALPRGDGAARKKAR